MKKKIINGLLFAVVLVAATSSFVSCKDYDGYNELQEKYATLQDAFNKQVTAMNDYVLTTRYNDETGYSAAELAAKGTIKSRLDDIEDELDPENPGSLAEQVHKNNIAIAKAQGLAERDSAYLRSLLAGWDNGGSLGDMVASAAQTLDSIHNNVWMYDSAFVLANKAWDFVNKGQVTGRGKKFETLQDMSTAFDEAVDSLQEEIEALQQDVNNILKLVNQQVTGIEIQGTVNPIYGTFAYPIGVQSNVVALYYGEFDNPVKFPAGDNGSQAGTWVGNNPVVLTSELEAIGAPSTVLKAGTQMNEDEGNAGVIYLTVNPSDVNMEGKEFTLRTSDNKVSKVALTPLYPSTDQLKWGYQRAAAVNSPNGFYVAGATISKENVKDVALTFNFNASAMKSQVKEIINEWRNPTAAAVDIAKLGLTVLNSMQANAPRLGVQAQWKDTLGWKNYVSKYDLAAVSAKPLGYDFLYGADYSSKVEKVRNKITGKEQALAERVIAEVAKALVFKLNLGNGGENIEIDADGNVWVIVSSTSAPLTITINKEDLGLAAGSVDLYITNDNKLNITPLFTAIQESINAKLAEVNALVATDVHKVLNKIISLEDKVFDKVKSIASNPNRFIQPALIARADNKFFYASRMYVSPTKVKKGTKIQFFPTTLTGEIVAPAFKKYVAVTNAWNGATVLDAKKFNTGIMNTVFDGNIYNMMVPFEYEVNGESGDVIEIAYECLGFNGKVAGKKYYIEVE